MVSIDFAVEMALLQIEIVSNFYIIFGLRTKESCVSSLLDW